MKKYLPIILFVLGLLVVAGAFFYIKNNRRSGLKEDEIVQEIPFENRPFASLTPSEDGHWLKLVVENINLEAATLDYELLYKLPDGRTQGVPGSISMDGLETLERDLLLGSESSGKFRYDEGVEEGTLTLRFRNKKGKLVGKVSTQFNLLLDTEELASADGEFTYTLEETPEDAFFVVMETFGVPENPDFSISTGPYGIFSSDSAKLPGEVEMKGATIYRWAGTAWKDLSSGESPDIGVFISSSE